MGFSSIDALVNAITVSGKFNKTQWNKITGAAAYTAGRWYNTFTLAGTPVAGNYTGTALNAQQLTDASQGAMWHGGNVSPDTKHLLNVGAVTAVATGVPTTLMLVDLLMYYPGINMNVATLQALVNGVGLPRYTTGEGVRGFLEITATTGATAHNISYNYTDEGGTAGSVNPVTVACTASAIVPHLTHSGLAANNYGPFLPLANGDRGIRSVQSVQLSAASGAAGTAALVLCKPLAQIPLTTLGVQSERDLLFQMPSLPKIEDGACLAWLMFTGAATAASTNFNGYLDQGWN